MTEAEKAPQATPDVVTSAEATSAAPAAPLPQKSTSSTLPLLIATLSVLIAATSVWWAPLVQPPSPPPAMQDDRVAALQDQIQQLNDKIAAAQQPAAPAAPAMDSETLARLGILEEAVKKADLLEEKLISTQAELKKLTESLPHRAKQDASDKMQLAAVLQLTHAWQTGANFATPWQMLISATEADGSSSLLAAPLSDAAALLLPWREKGIPTLAQLTARFQDHAREALQTTPNPQAGLVKGTLAQLGGLVTVRRTGEAIDLHDTRLDAVIARAEQKLFAGDLPACLEELDSLDTLPPAFEAWSKAARARVKADSLAEGLGLALAQKISGGDTAP